MRQPLPLGAPTWLAADSEKINNMTNCVLDVRVWSHSLKRNSPVQHAQAKWITDCVKGKGFCVTAVTQRADAFWLVVLTKCSPSPMPGICPGTKRQAWERSVFQRTVLTPPTATPEPSPEPQGATSGAGAGAATGAGAGAATVAAADSKEREGELWPYLQLGTVPFSEIDAPHSDFVCRKS